MKKLFLLLIAIFASILFSFNVYGLAHADNNEVDKEENAEKQNQNNNILIYTSIILGTVLVIGFTSFIFTKKKKKLNK